MTRTVSPAELEARVRTGPGLPLGDGTTAMFLGFWLEDGIVEEILPGRYRLTAAGDRVAAGLLEREDAA